jgi:hypothetical protein
MHDMHELSLDMLQAYHLSFHKNNGLNLVTLCACIPCLQSPRASGALMSSSPGSC